MLVLHTGPWSRGEEGLTASLPSAQQTASGPGKSVFRQAQPGLWLVLQ